MSGLSVEAQAWAQHRRYMWPSGSYFEVDDRTPTRIFVDLMEGFCNACGTETGREEVDVGVGRICGPWGCPSCGWSEDPRYDQRRRDVDRHTDQYGFFYPDDVPWL